MFFKPWRPIKSPIAQTAAEAASAPGCAFHIFWGLEIIKLILKKLGFRLGPDIAILSSRPASRRRMVVGGSFSSATAFVGPMENSSQELAPRGAWLRKKKPVRDLAAEGRGVPEALVDAVSAGRVERLT
jgi:hypothetical protein